MSSPKSLETAERTLWGPADNVFVLTPSAGSTSDPDPAFPAHGFYISAAGSGVGGANVTVVTLAGSTLTIPVPNLTIWPLRIRAVRSVEPFSGNGAVTVYGLT